MTAQDVDLSLESCETHFKNVFAKHPKARGVVIVIANKESGRFPNEPLEGVVTDCQQLGTVFSELGYSVIQLVNHRKSDIINCVSALSNVFPDDNPSYKHIIITFSGHGDESDEVHCKDGEISVNQEIIQPFLPKENPRLRSIPKLFFIDACRGNLEEVAVPRGGWDRYVYAKVSGEANYLLLRSTLSSKRAFEAGVCGGYWTQCFVKQLQDPNNFGKDIGYILIEVNRAVNMSFNIPVPAGYIQQALVVNTLLEHVVLLEQQAIRAHQGSLTNMPAEYNESPLQRGGTESQSDISTMQDSPEQPDQLSSLANHTTAPVEVHRTPMALLKEALIKQGVQEPRIEYTYKEERTRGGFRATAYVPLLGYCRGDVCRTKDRAQENVAKKAIRKLENED